MTREQKYHEALERIAQLAKAREVRGPFEEVLAPVHQVKAGGWVPIHPRTLQGLEIAAKIAAEALK